MGLNVLVFKPRICRQKIQYLQQITQTAKHVAMINTLHLYLPDA